MRSRQLFVTPSRAWCGGERQVEHDVRNIEELIRYTDTPATAHGIDNPPTGDWNPLYDESVTLEEREKAFAQWVAQYYPHKDLEKRTATTYCIRFLLQSNRPPSLVCPRRTFSQKSTLLLGKTVTITYRPSISNLSQVQLGSSPCSTARFALLGETFRSSFCMAKKRCITSYGRYGSWKKNPRRLGCLSSSRACLAPTIL